MVLTEYLFREKGGSMHWLLNTYSQYKPEEAIRAHLNRLVVLWLSMCTHSGLSPCENARPFFHTAALPLKEKTENETAT